MHRKRLDGQAGHEMLLLTNDSWGEGNLTRVFSYDGQGELERIYLETPEGFPLSDTLGSIDVAQESWERLNSCKN